MTDIVLLSGSSNKPLAQKVAKNLGIKLGKIEIEKFANNEKRIRILSDVKNKDVYIVQSTIDKCDEYIIELCLIADALKRLSPKKIIAVLPWFGYAPQDKVFREGEPLSSQTIIRILESSPIDEFVVTDIHSNIVLKMFKKKVHHLSAMNSFINYFDSRLDKNSWVAVALDNGSVERATLFAKVLGFPIAKFDKTRNRKTGVVTFHKLHGDVKGKNIITFDDYVSTGGTTIQSADFLKKEGIKKCYYCVTHLVVFGTAKKIEKSKIDKMFISDSINLPKECKAKNIKIVSIADLITEFINNRKTVARA